MICQVQLSACPSSGAGVHSWVMAESNRCFHAGLSPADAEQLITSRMTRPPSPANEVQTAIAKAYSEGGKFIFAKGTSFSTRGTFRRPVPITEIKFDPDKLARAAGRITKPGNWRHWLWERSPKHPTSMNAYSFLKHAYLPGNKIHVFDVFQTLPPRLTLTVSDPMDCRVPTEIAAGGRYGSGIWFLCNPVDGQWHPNPRQNDAPSCRSEESLTDFRFAVLESDQAPADLWLAFVAQLPVRITAIYTSGSRSIHCLIRLDARSKAEWDHLIVPLKRPLKVLGADPGCLSAVRLTRLPQCWRPEKRGFQKLLYLCPNPPLAPLVDLPALFPRSETLAHWRGTCPRWSPETEAFV